MDYELIDSSGTDDDLPPLQRNRMAIVGHAAENGRSLLGSTSFSRMHTDMEFQIHCLEQEAYGAILRAFKAQSDALTWEKEGLITELRKELRVSDDEHRELLNKVNTDDIICRIREWRKSGANHAAVLNTTRPVNGEVPSPTVSASHKRHKPSQSAPMAYGVLSQTMHPQSVPATTQPLYTDTNFGSALGAGGKKSRPGQMPGNVPRGRLNVHGSSRSHLMHEPTGAAAHDPLIGRKVMIRWPADSNFYEASIADFNPTEGRHALVYDKNTPNETWEWVTLKEIPPEDIRWIDDTPGVFQQGGLAVQSGGVENFVNHEVAPGIRRGGELAKDQDVNRLPSSQNGKASGEFEILHTETLIKQVEKMFEASHLDLLQIQRAKKMLKDHEQALVDVISKLADVSDNDSDGAEPPVSHGHSMHVEEG